MIFLQSVVRLRAGTHTDRGGNEVEDWTNPDRKELEKLHVQPLYQREDTDPDRQPVATGWRVYNQIGAGDLDVTENDRIELGADLAGGTKPVTCAVLGEIARWPHPMWGGIGKVEFTIQRFKG